MKGGKKARARSDYHKSPRAGRRRRIVGSKVIGKKVGGDGGDGKKRKKRGGGRKVTSRALRKEGDGAQALG